MSEQLRVLAVVPAYNEEESIRGVIAEVKGSGVAAEVLVIDDASGDATDESARAAGATVLRMPFNMGIGAIMQTGFRYCLRQGFDALVQVDGDGQHPAAALPAMAALLCRRASQAGADMVIASRFRAAGGYPSTFLRRIGIRFLSCLIWLRTGVWITDPTSGMRLMRREVVELFSREYADDYPEPESTVLALKSGFRVLEVPVAMRGRCGGRSSITPLRALYYMAKVSLALLLVSAGKTDNPGGEE